MNQVHMPCKKAVAQHSTVAPAVKEEHRASSQRLLSLGSVIPSCLALQDR